MIDKIINFKGRKLRLLKLDYYDGFSIWLANERIFEARGLSWLDRDRIAQ